MSLVKRQKHKSANKTFNRVANAINGIFANVANAMNAGASVALNYAIA